VDETASDLGEDTGQSSALHEFLYFRLVAPCGNVGDSKRTRIKNRCKISDFLPHKNWTMNEKMFESFFQVHPWDPTSDILLTGRRPMVWKI